RRRCGDDSPAAADGGRLLRRRAYRRRELVGQRPAAPGPAAIRSDSACRLGCADGGARGIAPGPMITRVASFVVLLYALGFVLFAFTRGKPAGAKVPATDAAVVVTGGKGRIEHAVEVLSDHKAKRL